MELLSFDSYRSYKLAQGRTAKRKGRGPFFATAEMERIAGWLRERNLEPKEGICHGARCGSEIVEFQKQFPNLKIIGSDLFPREGKSVPIPEVEIVKQDFMLPRPEWVGRFDLIYSNSLDHAFDPARCLRVWFDQLTEQGRLFLQWTFQHLHTSGGDCFGASLDELALLVMQTGALEDILPILYTRSRRCQHCFILVARARSKQDRLKPHEW